MSNRIVVISLSRQREAVAVTTFFEEKGWSVQWAGEGAEAAESIFREKPQFVITDSLAFSATLYRPGGEGETSPVCVICDPGDEVAAYQSADSVVVRPFSCVDAFWWVDGRL